MRKLMYIISVLLFPHVIYAENGDSGSMKCWEMIVEDSKNQVTFCIEGALFSSNTYHPNRGTNSLPTTCKQLGLIKKQGGNERMEVQLIQGVCANGMPVPIVKLECEINSSYLHCLYGDEYKLVLSPTHNKSLNSDAPR